MSRKHQLQTEHPAFSNFFGDIFKNNLKKLILFKKNGLAQESKNNKILRSPETALSGDHFFPGKNHNQTNQK